MTERRQAIPKVILYVAASLDGFIADRDGGVGWLDGYDSRNYGHDEFVRRIGTVIMGSRTYEQTLTFGAWPHKGQATYVVTHRQGLPRPDAGITFHGGDLGELVREIKAKGGNDVWLVGGAKLAASFFNAGLIDELMLFVIPVLLGDGMPLFGGLSRREPLSLLNVVSYPDGVAQLHYGGLRRAAG